MFRWGTGSGGGTLFSSFVPARLRQVHCLILVCDCLDMNAGLMLVNVVWLLISVHNQSGECSNYGYALFMNVVIAFIHECCYRLNSRMSLLPLFMNVVTAIGA